MHLTARDIERFWSKVRRGGPDECWPWIAGGTEGYGIFWAQGTSYRANRVAFILVHGDLREHEMACHSCDSPPCCNPNHLFRGNALANNRDAAEKGRYTKSMRRRVELHPETFNRGEDVHLAKLTEKNVRHIRRLFATGWSIKQIQTTHYSHVTWQNVNCIVRRKTWRHVA